MTSPKLSPQQVAADVLRILADEMGRFPVTFPIPDQLRTRAAELERPAPGGCEHQFQHSFMTGLNSCMKCGHTVAVSMLNTDRHWGDEGGGKHAESRGRDPLSSGDVQVDASPAPPPSAAGESEPSPQPSQEPNWNFTMHSFIGPLANDFCSLCNNTRTNLIHTQQPLPLEAADNLGLREHKTPAPQPSVNKAVREWRDRVSPRTANFVHIWQENGDALCLEIARLENLAAGSGEMRVVGVDFLERVVDEIWTGGAEITAELRSIISGERAGS